MAGTESLSAHCKPCISGCLFASSVSWTGNMEDFEHTHELSKSGNVPLSGQGELLWKKREHGSLLVSGQHATDWSLHSMGRITMRL